MLTTGSENKSGQQLSQHTQSTLTVCAVYFTAMSSLMYDLLLTRIFSVTVYYHFAFMAVSIAMFGIAAGGVVAYSFRAWFAKRDLFETCAVATLAFAVSAISAVLLHANLPMLQGEQMFSLNVLITFLAISLPFFFSGLTLSLVFKSFAEEIGYIYASDLIGASLGCLVLLWALQVMDGLSAVLFASMLALSGSLFFAFAASNRNLKLACVALFVISGGILFWSVSKYNEGLPPVRITWAKGDKDEKPPLYERWNTFSCITVFGDANAKGALNYPGMSRSYPKEPVMRGLNLKIDGYASTPMIGAEQDQSRLGGLKFDIAHFANYICPDSDVLIIGAGGGKDVLAALLFNQKHVTGLEINENTLHAVNEVFGEFTGHLGRNPKVTFINDEARSHLSRSKQHYDIIQMPFIDTWAATANGAFALTENSLYTREAFQIFLNHLTDRGIFSVSRWYNNEAPGEVLRLLSLTSDALKHCGKANPRQHIVLLRNLPAPNSIGVGTILVSQQPFSAETLAEIDRLAKQLQYDIVVSPNSAINPLFGDVADGKFEEVTKEFGINILPPTDDTPFFFNMFRPIDVFNPFARKVGYEPNLHAVFILFDVLAIGLAGTYLAIYAPLKVTRSKTEKPVNKFLIAYFVAIGIVFMFVEISLIQMLTVFLGHPVYGISIVICSLLFFSGVGSYLTPLLQKHFPGKNWRFVLSVAVCLALIGVTIPWVTTELRQLETVIRIMASVTITGVIGIFLGTALPLGIRVASKDDPEIVPLFWAINGAGSIVGPVLALMISLSWGITCLYCCSVVGYLLTAYILSRAENSVQTGSS